jgi:WS/DGAT/MGAT family acyltransferase
MSSADAAWLHMDRRTNLMVINSVLWFDEPLDWDAVQRVFDERVIQRFPRFHQRIREGLPGQPPAWCDEESFEPGLHFHRLALPAPGDRAALQAVVSDLISIPLDHGRPLWDVYLLEGYGSGCALLVRMHHAIADGIALARVMLSLTDSGGPPAAFSAPTRVSAATRAVRGARAVLRESAGLLRHPEWSGDLARIAVRDARTLAKLLLPSTDTASSLRGELAVGHRVAWSQPVSLRTVKGAGHALDATVNDVLVAAVSGAVGGYLRERGEDVAELHAMVPFNLRPLDAPLPRERAGGAAVDDERSRQPADRVLRGADNRGERRHAAAAVRTARASRAMRMTSARKASARGCGSATSALSVRNPTVTLPA